MQVDSLIVPQCIYRPGSFSGLMTLYESNYVKFEMLFGDGRLEGTRRVSASKYDCDLHVDVLRREPYTSTLKLTYWFEAEAGLRIADPDLLVRIYHDASLVEAVSGREKHHHHLLRALAQSHAGELDRRWRINIMLNKWLDYLLDNGHRFA
jgi:uncharacterized protein YqiB (DUF1249 family)